jgi:hypothetical protein
VREGAAVSSAAYPVRPRGRHCHAQVRSSGLQDQASQHVPPQHAYLSCGNNEEYLAHILAVLRVIEQKGLPKKCQVLAKAVARQSEALNNLKEVSESRDTVSTSVDVAARKVEIEQAVQMLQEAQKAHNKAIAESYKQLRNLMSGNAQSQWDCICREMHECDLWAPVNGQVTKGRRL